MPNKHDRSYLQKPNPNVDGAKHIYGSRHPYKLGGGYKKASWIEPPDLDEVDGGGAGEDAPGGGGGDVGGLGAAPWRDEAEEAGARRRESHRRRKSRRVDST